MQRESRTKIEGKRKGFTLVGVLTALVVFILLGTAYLSLYNGIETTTKATIRQEVESYGYGLLNKLTKVCPSDSSYDKTYSLKLNGINLTVEESCNDLGNSLLETEVKLTSTTGEEITLKRFIYGGAS